MIPAGAPLKAALDFARRVGPIIPVSMEGRPRPSDGLRARWRKACAKCGIVGLTFNDLLGTAVTRLALASCTEAEIATITGHSLRDVRSILDAHYVHRDPALAESAIGKLERERKHPTDLPPVRSVLLERKKNPREINGGRTRARTWDPLIKSQLLYQLSYAPRA